jgi:hypothetical protein
MKIPHSKATCAYQYPYCKLKDHQDSKEHHYPTTSKI